MNTKSYRLKEFFGAADGRSLVVDTSAGLSLGALPGLEFFSKAVNPLLGQLDAIVVSPGQARRMLGRTRQDAAVLVRADWTNALRTSEFVLHPETITRIPLLEPADALHLGASALVTYFLLGYEEQIEADCLRDLVQLALQGSQSGIPVLCDVMPTGPRVVLRSKAIELGSSYALEGGADGIAIPWPGNKSFETILTMAASVPVIVKLADFSTAPSELQEITSSGAAGFWLDERLFTQPDPLGSLQSLNTLLHGESIRGAG